MTSSNADTCDASIMNDSADRPFIRIEIRNIFYPILVVIAGMVITHLFFTWMVLQSNSHLYNSVQQVIEDGYLPVPNTHILPSLTQIGTALNGALFFTLTVGVAIPLLVYFAAVAWEIGYRRNRKFLIVLSGFVIFLMIMLNRHGFNPIVTLWFLSTYFIVFKLSSNIVGKARPILSPRKLLAHILLIGILAGMIKVLPAGTNFFIAIRDHLLLSNTIGEKITDYYYRYSPYPTEAIKPISKKQIKICRIDSGPDVNTLNSINDALLRYDFLPVSTSGDDDILVRIDNTNAIFFFVGGRRILSTSVESFLDNPDQILKRVSLRSDRNDITRRLLAFSLLYGLPLFTYVILFSFFRMVFLILPFRKHVFYLSAGSCLLIGIFSVLAIRFTAPAVVPLSMIKESLESPSANTRTVALKQISIQGLDPSDYLPGEYPDPPVYLPERIWWTISLAGSKDPASVQVLLELLDDPHPLVACKAYDSLRKKGYRPAIATILQKIGTSRHWYVQGYAYQALRSLGWKQDVSN